ncbi:MAG: penicillin-binding protein 1A [Proteobacteria bacterium]|nr:penicillin-binding protein 1A [Pseudomonadota bacterium]
MRLFKIFGVLCALFVLAAGLLLSYALLWVAPRLPELKALTDYQPKIPLRVYTADNVLLAEFGEEKRDFVPIKEIPALMKTALLDTEDEHFYQHGGVNYKGVLRAMISNLIHGGSSQGASTITMQVARNFFLSREKTYSRKINEIMLAYKIESQLSKDQILELYMNQIFLGERAFGFSTAARTYFGKPLNDITIAEAAMLAGLPKAPSAYNPVINPKRAYQRQRYILKRMHDLGHITQAQYDQALAQKLTVLDSSQRIVTHAEYAAEVVRKFMYAQYKEEAYTRGFNVYTTLQKADQDAAYAAVRRGMIDYDRRHGYRGPEAFIDLPSDTDAREEAIDDALGKHPDSDDLKAAVVLAASSRAVKAQTASGEEIDIAGEGLRFAAAFLPPHNKTAIRPGALIRVTQDAKKHWTIAQLPEVSAAFVALDARDGAYRALVGGFDFAQSQFDHVTQAWRQPGSTIKPFVYSASLEKGLSPGTIIDDAPLQISAAETGSQAWEPQNDDGKYDGPITMRTGLRKSKNLVSIRILRTITPRFVLDYLPRFGFDASKHPDNLTLTLGTGSVTPLQMAGAYSVFASGGYRHEPYLIAKVTDARGKVLAQKPQEANSEDARVIDARNAWLMDSMLRDVAHAGTGAAAGQKLGRADLAGKTGTTNDAMDGWFAGYGSDVVAVAWMGFDTPRSLGGREFGSTLALPIWIDYMRVALRGKPDLPRPMPAGLVQVDGDWMYQEYVGSNGVHSIGTDGGNGSNSGATDAIGDFWNRLFGGGTQQPQQSQQSQQPQAPAAQPRNRSRQGPETGLPGQMLP